MASQSYSEETRWLHSHIKINTFHVTTEARVQTRARQAEARHRPHAMAAKPGLNLWLHSHSKKLRHRPYSMSAKLGLIQWLQSQASFYGCTVIKRRDTLTPANTRHVTSGRRPGMWKPNSPSMQTSLSESLEALAQQRRDT